MPYVDRNRVISVVVLVSMLLAALVGSGAKPAEADQRPAVRAQPEWNQFWLTQWPPDAEVTVVVDDDDSFEIADSASFLSAMTVRTDATGQATAHFDEDELLIVPGQYVTATDGVTIKELHIPELTASINDRTGEVFGTTSLPDSSGSLEVLAFTSTGDVTRASEATASWSVSLTAPPIPPEQGSLTAPLPDGLQGQVLQVDVDGDETVLSWYLVWRGVFRDDDDSVFETNIDWLATEGITMGCNPPANDRFCPEDPVTRGQMAAFLVRALGLVDQENDPFVDDDGLVFEADIERLAAAEITMGCNPPLNDRFCPGDVVTRGQMAAFLTRSLDLTDSLDDPFRDDDDSVFEADIEKLAAAEITVGCNPPVDDRFCPDQPVTRGQMAAFLNRALDG